MQKKIQVLSSGIPLADKEWGGFYSGGTYLMVGSHKSGRTLLSLQFAMEAAKQNEVCLFFTSARPKDLLIQAASIGIDLQESIEKSLIIVVRVAAPAETDIIDNSGDNYLVEYIKDIITVVEQYNPSKIVFDELTPFVEFKDCNLLQRVFAQACEKIEDKGITSLYALSEPATSAAETIVDSLITKVIGVIYLKKENGEDQAGEMIITPNIGHSEGQFTAAYRIEPYKGITIAREGREPNLVVLKNKNVA